VSDPKFVIPADRLPPGFAEAVDQPPRTVVEPKPAATVVLLREARGALEVLLLKRHRSAGFVPGAYVFPGGRIDEGDADPRLVEGAAVPQRGNVPAHFWFGAVREVFEETGVLLAHTPAGEWAPDASTSNAFEEWRMKLMANETRLIDMVAAERLRLVLDHVVYFAHWITPAVEPRRYDTRFFAAALPPNRTIRPDARETVDAIWITPRHALERFETGGLPMVFPTVRTLQDFAAFASVAEALATLQLKAVEPVLPRLVRTEAGVGIVIDSDEEVR
jgi:8-oxo-dGTP pyrophosphatase MutT (NUDIX family)